MKRSRGQRRKQGANVNRALDSNGPDVKIRGTAAQIYDKYLQLSRDAQTAGDRVKGENYLQHAEHYFRIMRSMQASQTPQQQPDVASGEADQDGQRSAPPSDDAARPTESSPGDSEAKTDGGETAASQAADSAESSDAAPAEDAAPRAPRRRRQRRAPNGAAPASDGASTAAAGSEPAADKSETAGDAPSDADVKEATAS